MPMMIVEDEDFELEQNKCREQHDNVIRRPFHGRNPGDLNVPSAVRELIADDSSSTQKELSEALGISRSSVTAYQNGATSTATYDKKDNRLAEVLEKKNERIGLKSRKRLIQALDAMEGKFSEAKLTELSTVAANMSRVVEKIGQKESALVQNNIIFYAPTPVKTNPYEVIDLGPVQSSDSRK